MNKLSKRLVMRLEERKKQGVFRSLSTQNHTKVDFFSNDYLGYANQSESIISCGSTGSRLISGTHDTHLKFEKFSADFHEGEAALVFNSGYDANIGFFSSIPQKGDVVLYDELIHASIRDGMRLSLANNYRFKHNDLDDLEQKIIQHQTLCETLYVVVESVYSMDGDSPDFEKLRALATQYSIHLIIDEAHSLGVYGSRGEGLSQTHSIAHLCFARLYTFGKALGRHGAIWVGSQELVEYLTNFARSFIYTTALPSSAVQEIHLQYKKMIQDEESREQLEKNIQCYQSIITAKGLKHHFTLNHSPIQSFFGVNKVVLQQISNTLQENGFNVKPIFHPTVPEGKERLRISLHSFNTTKEINTLVEIIEYYV